MEDQQVCQWVIDQRVVLSQFLDAAGADPARADVFKRLLSINNEMVYLFWGINIARAEEHLDPLAHPTPIIPMPVGKE